jgi:hypothetical protein
MKPNRTMLTCLFVILLLAGTVSAFKANYHQDITTNTLSTISRTIGAKALNFTPTAIKEVADADYDVDCGGVKYVCSCQECQMDPSRHFDSENYSTSSLRIVKLKEAIIANLSSSSPNGAVARAQLGQALHTIQDFYAHSTWVQIGGTGINMELGRQVLENTDNDLASPVAATCSDSDHATLTSPVGQTEVTTGFFLASKDNGTGTTGICYIGPVAGKCRHGDFGANDLSSIYGVCPTGISQDRPSRPFYSQATSLAIAATNDFVSQILDYNGGALDSGSTYPAIAGNLRATEALMGIRITTLGIVVDTTGSMTDIQAQVKSAVGQIVNSLVGTPDEPGTYLLEPFNDPTWGPPIKTSDAPTFLNAVNSLTASGGGDCPELPFSGLLDAINASDPQGAFFLFTDASAKDDYLANDVIEAANQKGIVIKFMLFGSCSPIDPAYYQVAAATGGQAFVLNRNEASNSAALIQSQLVPSPATLLTASGTLTGQRTYSVPIDSTVTSVTFSVSIDTPGTITISRPSGAAVMGSDPGVTLTSLSSGEFVAVNGPAAGVWKVQISGSGNFSVAAIGNSTLQFQNFQFVGLGGRPGHSGLYPIFGQPLSGSTQTGMATLTGPFATANFQLVSAAGDTLQSMNLAPGSTDAPANAFTGTVSLPSSAFRPVVTGTDNTGAAYQRYFSQISQGQAVSVSSAVTTSILAAGATVTIPFLVQNGPSAATYKLAAIDNLGFVSGASHQSLSSGASPSSLTLAANASGTVNVTLAVPSDAAQGSGDAVTLTATSSTDATVTNGATASFTVDTVLSQTSLTFAPQTVGTTSGPQSFVIANGSAAAMLISQISADPEFSQTNNCGNSLAASTECTIAVTFSPVTFGSRGGTATISDSTMLSPHVVILTGTGVDFSIAPGSSSQNVTAGQMATFNINLTTQGGGLANAITFACTGLPANSVCSFNPTSLAAGASTGATAMTISTTAHTSLLSPTVHDAPAPVGLYYPMWILLVAMIVVAYFVERLRNRRLRTEFLILSFVVFLAVLIISCGGGGITSTSSSGNSGNLNPATGTPAGTSTVTVTTSGAAARSTSLTLTVY